MKPEYNLGWGDPVVVRQALTEVLEPDAFTYAKVHLATMGYPPHDGNVKLIEQLKELACRQSGGRKPKHLFVTCGATGAINAALYALKTIRTDWVVTDKRYYPIFPSLIGLSDMIMIDRDKANFLSNSSNGCVRANFIELVVSPSAPEGLVFPFHTADIWDAAYASRTYSSKMGHVPEKYRVMCGSLSKTLGLSGLRLGWVSTDEDELANSLRVYTTASYAGISSISMAIAEQVLQDLNLYGFENLSAMYLNDNREQVQKVLTKFGQSDVPTRGMFAILQLGKPERKALTKANVKWQPGSSWGEDDNWARLSLGQSRETVRAAVKAILK